MDTRETKGMMLRNRIATVLGAAFVALAAAGWYFVSPGWTLSHMKAAADCNDPRALSAYVDYPALRASIKSELAVRMSAVLESDRSDLGELGTTIGGALIDPMVDRLVSPGGLQAAMTGRQEGVLGTAGAGALRVLKVPQKPVITRLNFSEFIVGPADRPSSGLLFRRHGLSWKLSGIVLPPNTNDGPANAS